MLFCCLVHLFQFFSYYGFKFFPVFSIELFKLNVELFENDGNLWDSLGDGYLANDQKEEAIKSFKKAVELGNEDSLKKLKELL